MSIVELPSQTASDRCEQPDQTAAIRGARLSSTLHMSSRGRHDKPLRRLNSYLRSRLPRQLTTDAESAKARRGGKAAQKPRAKSLTRLGFQAATYRTGLRTGRA